METMPNNESRSFPLDGTDLLAISESDLVQACKKSPVVFCLTGGTHVYRITQTAVVKIKGDLSQLEASNMAYIAQNLGEEQIRVPRVYRSFVIQSESYLVMQYVDGESLDAIPWMSRPPDQRKDIIKQATDAVLALRTLEAKAPGPVERSGFPTGGFFSDYGANTVFANISEMEQWLDRKLRIYNRHDQALLRGTSWSLSGCFKTLVMCHMDIALRNLKLDRHGRLWFLDWEWAGFYPPEFEIAYLHCIIGEGADLEFFKDLLRGLGSLDRNDVVDKLHQVYYVNNSCFAASHIVGVDC